MALTATVEVLDGSDLVALAQCMALDATVFPHPSLPLVHAHSFPRVWIARASGSVAGFVATLRRSAWLEVVGLAVDEAQRRQGMGRALLHCAIDAAAARQLAGVALHVSTANEHACRLYENESFRIARVLRRFYSPARFGNGGDAYEMVRRNER